MPCPYFKKGQKFCILIDGNKKSGEAGKKDNYRWHVGHGYCEEMQNDTLPKYTCCCSYIERDERLKNQNVWSVS